MWTSRPINVGAVSYLNTKPLVYGLSESDENLRVVYDLPSRLADRLQRRDLDVALIPSFEFLRHTDYLIVSDACIGCRQRVMSVKLFADRPLSEVRSLALDEGSRTSAVLVQILLDHLEQVAPTLHSLPIGHGLDEATTDAVLLIGDRAINVTSNRYRPVWDLGELWNLHFGKPFVFAVWAAHTDLDNSRRDRISHLLQDARDRGVAAIESIAAREHDSVGLPILPCVDYLRHHLHFFLETGELAGLDLFRREALLRGFLTHDTPIRFHDCKIA